ncbi:hypothetical protein ACWD2L_06020 [Streptomyces sp. NPDC002754]
MTARDELIASFIAQGAPNCPCCQPYWEKTIDDTLTQHAHELAEQIRNTYTGPDMDRQVRYGADLIGPEVS